jgi:triacylglycerol esterase/lipase EstA (alpha/beta hydrolase family)
MPRLTRCAIAATLALAIAAPVASAESSLANPPLGANNFSCSPSATHPDPVVLVHGLGADMAANWTYMSPLLASRGYCVFALTYGLDPRLPVPGGVIPIEQSATELGAFVDRVLAATGARKVDLVGHSEGTFMPEYWLKYDGGAAKVNRYVAVAPLYAGTDVAGLALLRDLATPFGLAAPLLDLVGSFCGSCSEFLAGSKAVQEINAGAGGAAAPGVTYTTIMTRYDELVEPYTSGMLHAPNATDIVLQDVCPNDVSDHVALAFDPVVAQLIFNALDPSDPQPVSCLGLPPFAPPPGLLPTRAAAPQASPRQPSSCPRSTVRISSPEAISSAARRMSACIRRSRSRNGTAVRTRSWAARVRGLARSAPRRSRA